jgi:hypothetical protein
MLLTSALAVLGGCAQISVQHLTPDGTQASGAPGLRYYLPKPYLLVTLLPPSSTSGSSGQQHVAMPPPVAPTPAPTPGLMTPPGTVPPPPAPTPRTRAGAGTASPNPTTTKSDTTTPGQQSTPAPATDTSFQANNDQYTIKLIYLPDLHNPMTINMTAGLFGTAGYQPTLQDGWMLTSLQGSTDNSQMVQLVEAAITAAAGGGSKAATGGVTTKAGGAPEELAALLPKDTVLSPGLYSFRYDPATGYIVGVCAVTYFRTGGNAPGECPFPS